MNWIKVLDKTPDDARPVWVAGEASRGDCYPGFYSNGYWYRLGSDTPWYDVTHWAEMEMPAGPELEPFSYAGGCIWFKGHNVGSPHKYSSGSFKYFVQDLNAVMKRARKKFWYDDSALMYGNKVILTGTVVGWNELVERLNELEFV